MPDKSRIPVIVGAARTPIGKFLGALSSLSAPELGAIAIREALKRSKVPVEDVQEVIMGHVIQGGTGQAPGERKLLACRLVPLPPQPSGPGRRGDRRVSCPGRDSGPLYRSL